ncbi:MAG: hypothetical protein SVO01_11775 [Thermotogota bacterium]|nr:hypothetical protein [Thermotogota bacterium]
MEFFRIFMGAGCRTKGQNLLLFLMGAGGERGEGALNEVSKENIYILEEE